MNVRNSNISSLNLFVLSYLAAAIILLTLSPFDFQAYVPAEFWVIRVSLEDVSRNILLFIPLGILLRHTFWRSHGAALVGGLLLSLSIECAQLFIEARTSNLADLMSNSAGAFVGSIVHQQLFEFNQLASKPSLKKVSDGVKLPVSMMFVPVCWLTAMRSITDPAAVWFALPSAIAGILLIQQIQPTQRKQQYVTAFCWSVLALLPLVNTSPSAAWVFGLLTPILIYVGANLSGFSAKRVVILSISVGFVLTVWYVLSWNTLPEKFLYGQEKVTFEIIFRFAQIIFLALAVFVCAITWRKL